MEYKEEQLKEIIEKHYGFKRELIQNPVQCGVWHVQFEVNGIKYYGSIPFYGALPMLNVSGYTTQYYYHDTPVTEDYYNQYIKERMIRILYANPYSGEWEDTNVRFKTQEEAKKFIGGRPDPDRYWYDFLD